MKRKLETFTVVGGGSAYTPGLLLALLHYAPALALKTVKLYDIHSENLETVGALGKKLTQAQGLPFQIETCHRLEDALCGTDAVLNTTRPGGLECRHIDETLPLEFEIPGQETVGPGGFFFALRSVPQALHLAETMKKVCPQAILLNYTNPTNIVTQALQDSGVEVIGLCDQSDEDMEALALALKESPLRFDCVGLNHATWYTNIANSGGVSVDVSRAETPPPSFDEEHKLRFRFSAHLAQEAAGYWPNSYLAYYFFPQEFVRLSRTIGTRASKIMEKMPSYYRHFRDEAEKEKPHVTNHRGSAGFGDMAVKVLMALKGENSKELVLNLPNHHTTSFCDRTVVETKVLNFRPLPNPRVPESSLNLLARLENYQLAAAEACAQPLRANLIRALSENPFLKSKDQAEKMLNRAKALYGTHIQALQ